MSTSTSTLTMISFPVATGPPPQILAAIAQQLTAATPPRPQGPRKAVDDLRGYLQRAHLRSIRRNDQSHPYALPPRGARSGKNNLHVSENPERRIREIRKHDKRYFNKAVTRFTKKRVYNHESGPPSIGHGTIPTPPIRAPDAPAESLSLEAGNDYINEGTWSNMIPYPSSIGDTLDWLKQGPLQTIQRALHLAFPDTHRWWFEEDKPPATPGEQPPAPVAPPSVLGLTRPAARALAPAPTRPGGFGSRPRVGSTLAPALVPAPAPTPPRPTPVFTESFVPPFRVPDTDEAIAASWFWSAVPKEDIAGYRALAASQASRSASSSTASSSAAPPPPPTYTPAPAHNVHLPAVLATLSTDAMDTDEDFIVNADKWRTFTWRFHPTAARPEWYIEPPKSSKAKGKAPEVSTDSSASSSKFALRPRAIHPSPHTTLTLIVQPPYELSLQDLVNVSQVRKISSSTGPNSSRRKRVWARIVDTCKKKGTRMFILTTYEGWMFGKFDEEWEGVNVSEVVEWCQDHKDAEGGNGGQGNARGKVQANVVEAAMYWIAESIGLGGTGRMIPVVSPDDDDDDEAREERRRLREERRRAQEEERQRVITEGAERAEGRRQERQERRREERRERRRERREERQVEELMSVATRSTRGSRSASAEAVGSGSRRSRRGSRAASPSASGA